MPPKGLAAMQSHCFMQPRWWSRRAHFWDINQSTVATQRLALGLTIFREKVASQLVQVKGLSKWCQLTPAARILFHMQETFSDSAPRSAAQLAAVRCYDRNEGGLRGLDDVS
jgi:hypothetical protein